MTRSIEYITIYNITLWQGGCDFITVYNITLWLGGYDYVGEHEVSNGSQYEDDNVHTGSSDPTEMIE